VFIYTSGTTGNPKGALIPHRALIGNLLGLRLQPKLVWLWRPRQAAVDGGVSESPADWAWTGWA